MVEIFLVRDRVRKFNSSEITKIISLKKVDLRKGGDPRVAYLPSLREITSWQDRLLWAQLT